MRHIIICDIDGVLANHSHRLHFVDRPVTYELISKSTVQRVLTAAKNWDAFYSAMKDDPVNEWCGRLLTQMDTYADIIFVTGRPDQYRTETCDWIDKAANWYGFYFGNENLYMRPSFRHIVHDEETVYKVIPDYRPACEVKEDYLKSFLARNYKILFVLEDMDDCAAMYKRYGLTVLKVL